MNQAGREVDHSARQIVIGTVEPDLHGSVPSILIADCLGVVEAANPNDSKLALSHDASVLARDPSLKCR